MSETTREWLGRELQDFEPVWRSFRSKQQRMYYIWMAVAVAGMVALGFVAGYDWTYVVRVHLAIGVGIAVFIWLCVLLTSRASTMKTVRKSFEKALSVLSPSDQATFAQQEFGRADFLNTFEDSFPARLLVGPDFWLYFRGVCQIYRVADMEKLRVQEEKTQLHLGQAVIARLEAHMAAENDKSVLEKISFDDVPVTEFTQEKAVERYPDWTGNEVMWLHYGLEYKYDLNFDMSTGYLNGFTVERTYDVDWNS